MPSLRKRVSSYFRQLSFYNEPRDKTHNINENSFITKYLEGNINLKEGPPILYGKNPTDLPNYDLSVYDIGDDSTIGCFSGPNGGLTTIKRLEKHLSVPDTDIDFIDTQDEVAEAASTTESTEQTTDPNLPGEWNRKSDCIYGISDSLYDKNLITQSRNGDPIADCFGIIARRDSAILAVADGVNWGEKACIAAKSAVHGCLHYLDKTIFNDAKPFDRLYQNEIAQNSIINHNRINNTRDIFVCLLRAFNCAHDLILENEGMLTTLTVAIVLPLNAKNIKPVNKFRDHRSDTLHRGRSEHFSVTNEDSQTYVCCICNVGDTLAYVYSQKYGMRELTKGSHDVNCNRDMRDALGALGPVDGINPELSNLTLSVTTVQKGDIILVASDGLTDNFDPNVCKFTVNAKDSLRPKRPSASQQTQHSHNKENVKAVQAKAPVKPPRKTKETSLRTNREQSVESIGKPSSSRPKSEAFDNPLVAQFMHDNAFDKTHSLDNKHKPSQIKSAPVTRTIPAQPKSSFLRSKTTIEMRTSAKTILRNEDGVPYVTPMQRYEISLLLMEDVLKHGISGNDAPCTTAKKLCENLVKFAFSISSAKRHTLEDADLYFNNVNGVLVEISHNEKKVRRKKGLERVQNLPGKLDHVSVVAYNVGNYVV